jgi:hypothetical protein
VYVLFIGTRLSNLYTAVDTPAEAAWLTYEEEDTCMSYAEEDAYLPCAPCTRAPLRLLLKQPGRRQPE